MMPVLHLGQLELEVGRGLFARMPIPPIGEQNTADIQKHAGDFRCLLHRLQSSIDRIIAAKGLVRVPARSLDRLKTTALPAHPTDGRESCKWGRTQVEGLRSSENAQSTLGTSPPTRADDGLQFA